MLFFSVRGSVPEFIALIGAIATIFVLSNTIPLLSLRVNGDEGTGNGQALQSIDNSLKVTPFPIIINIPAHIPIPPYGLQITGPKNITGIKAQFSDLAGDSQGSLWIPRNQIRVEPKTFDVTAGQLTDVSLILNLTNITGSYHGTMTLYYAGGFTQVAIKINLFEDYLFYIISIIVLGLGIVTAFFVKLIRIQNDARQEALSAFNDSRNEMMRAKEDGRCDMQFDTGVTKFFQGLELIEQGSFSEAKNLLNQATQDFKDAKVEPEPEKGKPAPEPDILRPNTEIPTESKAIEISRKVSGTGLTKSLRQDSALLYVVSTILLFVAIVEVWITVLPKLIPTINSVFVYLSTFLAGYGSQSVLGDIIEFSRRR